MEENLLYRNEKVRQTNIELLRLFTMFVIVFYHLLLTPNAAVDKAFNVMLHIAVPCFVLVSGFFGIRVSVKGFLRLFVEAAGYSAGIYICYCIAGNNAFSVNLFIQTFVNFYPGYWFIGTYFGLYLLSPIINSVLADIGTNKKLFYIIMLSIISFWLELANVIVPHNNDYSVTNFVLLYSIGNFLRHNIKHDKIYSNRYIILLCYIALNVILVTVFISTSQYEYFQSILYKIFFPYNSPGLLLNAVLCFLVFSTIRIQSSMINWFAQSTFAIYLIHGGLLRGKLQAIVTMLKDNMVLFPLFWISLAVFSFVVCFFCILFDKLVQPIIKGTVGILYKNVGLYKIDNKIKLYLK